MRRPEKITLSAVEAVGHLRALASDMGPREMLDEIRSVFYPKKEVWKDEKSNPVSRSCELGVWNRISREIRMLQMMGFTSCMLIEAVKESFVRTSLNGSDDGSYPELPACDCRFCT